MKESLREIPFSSFESIDRNLIPDFSSLNLGSNVKSTLSRFLEIHEETAQHCLRTGALARLLAQQVGLDTQLQETIFIGGALHDIGKTADVLLIDNKLTTVEEEFVKQNSHTTVGERTLASMGFPQPMVDIVKNHHKRFVKERNNVDLSTQIVMVADRFDAIKSARFYNPGTSYEQALIKLRGSFGIYFDESLRIPFEAVVRDHLL